MLCFIRNGSHGEIHKMKHIFLFVIGFFQFAVLGNCQFQTDELLNLFKLTEDLNVTIDRNEAELFAGVNNTDSMENCMMNCPLCPVPPKKCPNKDVTFWLYTEGNSENPVKLTLETENGIDLSKAQTGSPWKIILHGYTMNKDKIPNPELRSEYFKKGPHNIISVDYEPLAPHPCYISAVKNVALVSECTAQMIDALVEKNAFKMPDVHVIGFSLGAQIAGRLHRYLKSGKPGRVTALDPASPLFDGLINPIVTRSSADFVDIIHTDILLKGKIEPLGHIDFYPNGGSFQPGCLFDSNRSFSDCNHDRSPFYFAESINSKVGFYGVRCASYLKFMTGICGADEKDMVIMGEYTPRTAKGIYQLQTNDHSPFAMGKSGRRIR